MVVILRPVKGLSTTQIGAIQNAMIGYNNLMKPYYAPRLFIDEVDDQQIIVLWVIAGSERPYEVPESVLAKHKLWKYFIRKYASSIEAKGIEKEELISLTNRFPFDDRSNMQARVENISMILVKDYLVKVKSRLAEQIGKIPDLELLSQMELVSGPNEHIFSRNVGLMLFSEYPEKFFPYTQVEVVEFPEGDAGPYTELEPITGPVALQISRTLAIIPATPTRPSKKSWSMPFITGITSSGNPLKSEFTPTPSSFSTRVAPTVPFA